MKNKDNQPCNQESSTENQQNTNTSEAQQATSSEPVAEQPTLEADKNTDTTAQLEEKLAEANDKYLRMCAEFDNYRKRTLKERMDMLKFGGEEIIKGLLPVLDDVDRSVEAMDKTEDIQAIREGVKLIQTKLLQFLSQQGLAELEAKGLELDTDLHDAITTTPVAAPEQKGKIVDVIQKGYKLHDKIVRHAKVVIGE